MCLCVIFYCKCGGVALGHYCDIKLLYSSAGSEIVVIGGHLPIRPTIKLIRDDICTCTHIIYTRQRTTQLDGTGKFPV